MTQKLMSRIPVPEIQTNIVEAITKYKALYNEEPDKLDWEDFRSKCMNLKYDKSWLYYYQLQQGLKPTVLAKVDDVELLKSLDINNKFFLRMIEDFPDAFKFSQAIIPKLQDLQFVLSPKGKDIWKKLNVQKYYNELTHEEI